MFCCIVLLILWLGQLTAGTVFNSIDLRITKRQSQPLNVNKSQKLRQFCSVKGLRLACRELRVKICVVSTHSQAQPSPPSASLLPKNCLANSLGCWYLTNNLLTTVHSVHCDLSVCLSVCALCPCLTSHICFASWRYLNSAQMF